MSTFSVFHFILLYETVGSHDIVPRGFIPYFRLPDVESIVDRAYRNEPVLQTIRIFKDLVAGSLSCIYHTSRIGYHTVIGAEKTTKKFRKSSTHHRIDSCNIWFVCHLSRFPP